MTLRRSATSTLSPDDQSALFRDLYTRALGRIGGRSRDGLLLGVTSAIAGEGKTTIARNLAVTLAGDRANAGRRYLGGDILMVDCQPDHTGLSHEFHVPETPGLVQYLRGTAPIDVAAKRTSQPGLWLMPIGDAAHDLPVLMRGAATQDLTTRLGSHFGLVILDLPPVLTTSDTEVFIELVDQVVFVVRAGVTPSQVIKQALRGLERAKLAGLVINDSRPDLPAWLQYRL